MRTCLGAASSFEKHHLPGALMQSMHLLHCEGYTAYKPGVLESVAEASKAAGATFSLDMASFEVVRNCWTSLQPIIESGRVEVLFCNEDEASEIVSQYGTHCSPKPLERTVFEYGPREVDWASYSLVSYSSPVSRHIHTHVQRR